MTDEPLPESDRAGDAPHPRETARLIGHAAAERQFLDAATGGRLHHAWLVSGPAGIGKATFAWKAARFLLSAAPEPAGAGLFGDAPPRPDTLDTAPDSPLASRMRALSEPSLHLIRRAWDFDRKRLKTQITVDEVRKLNGFFALAPADGGRRVVIVDSADELNASAANALLKVLEEPPKNTVMFLIAHAPARLLPTIRSRCRDIRLSPLAPDALKSALAELGVPPDEADRLAPLAGGSVGAAIRLRETGGTELFDRLMQLVGTAPGLRRDAALALADHVAARGAEDRRAVFMGLVDKVLAELARAGVGAPPDPALSETVRATLARLSPSPDAGRRWAALQQSLSERTRRGLAVNVDPVLLILQVLLDIDATARA